ncbi:MAG: recombinase family protein [Planctomycetes bacterium]|nr:recombinase family protein [Planctomycetota bacterium]
MVRRILESWRRGSSYGRIAAEMNTQGVKTKRRARWYPSTVRAIVQRRAWYFDVLGAI